MSVERKVCYSALFTNVVGWHAGTVSFPLSDTKILAQQACPLALESVEIVPAFLLPPAFLIASIKVARLSSPLTWGGSWIEGPESGRVEKKSSDNLI